MKNLIAGQFFGGEIEPGIMHHFWPSDEELKSWQSRPQPPEEPETGSEPEPQAGPVQPANREKIAA